MKLTKTVVDRLPVPPTSYTIHWDEVLPGFGVRVTTSGVKAFILQRRIKGREKRITLGRYGALTVEQARKEAQKLLGKIASGQDPVAERTRAKLEAVTLGEVFEAYLARRSSLKPLTISDMRRVMREGLQDWLKKPITGITPDMVVRRHQILGERSQARANLTMRYLRAVFNFTMAEYTGVDGKPIIEANPVKRLSQTRGWYKVDRRKTVIRAHELGAWVQAVLELPNPAMRDYFMLVLLTGMRRQEALSLKWEHIDIKARTLTVIDPKNRRDHTLPLSDYLFDLLTRRKETAVGEYVFTDTQGRRISNFRYAQERVKDCAGVSFCIHDLRRTFATVAESLDIPAYALKRLLNHADGADVTAGYIVADVERLRGPMQRITDYILKCGGVTESAQVLMFEKKTVEY